MPILSVKFKNKFFLALIRKVEVYIEQLSSTSQAYFESDRIIDYVNKLNLNI